MLELAGKLPVGALMMHGMRLGAQDSFADFLSGSCSYQMPIELFLGLACIDASILLFITCKKLCPAVLAALANFYWQI